MNLLIRSMSHSQLIDVLDLPFLEYTLLIPIFHSCCWEVRSVPRVLVETKDFIQLSSLSTGFAAELAPDGNTSIKGVVCGDF